LSSGKHPPGYFRDYYLRNRERIIASISENRRRRKAENRARLAAAGLYPLPPEHHDAMRKRAILKRRITRILSLPDVYADEEAGPTEEGREAS
jgi:hypothetical protein